MEIKSVQKFVKIAPQKARVVADLIRKMSPLEAVEVLPHIQKKAALPILKVIKSALANARQAGLTDTELVFKEVQINESTRLKRGTPVSRGVWHPIVKRMSHIRIVLTDETKKKVVTVDTKSVSAVKEIEKNEVKPKVQKKGAAQVKKNTK